MENYNNEIFGFSNDTNEELEQANNFNFDTISGLGQSDYENEDLFNTEVETNESNYLNDYRIGNFDNISNENYQPNIIDEQNFESIVENTESLDNNENEDFNINNFNGISDEINYESNKNVADDNEFESLVIENNVVDTDKVEEVPILNEEIFEAPKENEYEEPVEIQEFIQPEEIFEVPLQPLSAVSVENEVVEEVQNNEENNFEPEITISETPIEELNKLTHFEEERIEETDINALFDKVSVNVKDASDIFRKNTDLKQKIDTRFEELKKLQSELENSRKKQIDEINAYKEEVLSKLTEKKEEIERRLNILKESQATLEKEKKEFESYKKKEQENIDKVQKEVQSAYDDRREELNHIEDVLRKQKDALDEERSQLSLDRIQYESDKNELANNLLKFNELVNSFTNGMNDIKG